MMEIKNISYRYKGGPKVLKDISFNIEPGQFLAILGNNGVGKSTLLKCFNHILKPDAGEVILDNENLLTMSAREVAKRVAFAHITSRMTMFLPSQFVRLNTSPACSTL